MSEHYHNEWRQSQLVPHVLATPPTPAYPPHPFPLIILPHIHQQPIPPAPVREDFEERMEMNQTINAYERRPQPPLQHMTSMMPSSSSSSLIVVPYNYRREEEAEGNSAFAAPRSGGVTTGHHDGHVSYTIPPPPPPHLPPLTSIFGEWSGV